MGVIKGDIRSSEYSSHRGSTCRCELLPKLGYQGTSKGGRRCPSGSLF